MDSMTPPIGGGLDSMTPYQRGPGFYYRPYLPIRHTGGHMGGSAPDFDDPSSLQKDQFVYCNLYFSYTVQI